MKNETVLAVRPMTSGQFKDIVATLVQSAPDYYTFEDANNFTGSKGAFLADLGAVFAKYTISSVIERAIVQWQVFYRDVFGLTCDFSAINIPAQKEGFTRLIIVAQDMDPQRAFGQCKQTFPSWKYTEDSLDTAVPTNDRDPKNGSYAIWMRDRVEADEELANKSADDLKQEAIAGNTLLERLLLELKYFGETGKHLDINNVTACTGSRDSDGYVPRVYWHDDELLVSWYSVAHRYPVWRSREVVS